MCPQPKPHIHENNSSDDATDKPLTPVVWSYSQIEFSVPIRYIIILILIAFLCFRDYSRRAVCLTPIRLSVLLSTALEKFVKLTSPTVLSSQSETLHSCYRHIENMRSPFEENKDFFL